MSDESHIKVPLIIAHRGESEDAPENTLSSVNLAWQRNDDAVEIDIHLTSDNHIAVIHDFSTKRTGDVNLKIKNSTLEQLKKVDVGTFKNVKWKNERIPVLSEVLATIPLGKKLIIEIKCSKKVIPFLRDELNNFNINREQVEIISFSYSTLKEAKKQLPQFKTLWLLNLDYNWFTKLTSLSGAALLLKAKKNGFDGVDAFAGKQLTEQFIEKAKSLNLLVYTWTVDNTEQALQLAKMGINAITTNSCNRIKTTLIEQISNQNQTK